MNDLLRGTPWVALPSAKPAGAAVGSGVQVPARFVQVVLFDTGRI
ncbi:hypothetical protein ACIBEK_28940 [Nocardia fusca]